MSLPYVDAVILGAMDEEVAPYIVAGRVVRGVGPLSLVELDGLSLLVGRTKPGMVNAAAGLAMTLSHCSPAVVISTGSAGGLHHKVELRDVVVGTTYTYSQADATAFGYALGQVPSMPPSYRGDDALIEAAVRAPGVDDLRVLVGPVVTSDSFVTRDNVQEVRSSWPAALSTDMESTALAQVAHSQEVPFLSVRGISDLCGPEAGSDFGVGLDAASSAAFRVVRAALREHGFR